MQFINRLNDNCDPGEAMKKTQIMKGICNEFAALAQIEARRDMSCGQNSAPALKTKRYFVFSR